MTDHQREKFEAAVVARLKESGFLEIEIRTEALVRCDDGYQDEVINAGWHYWNAGLVAAGQATTALVLPNMSDEEIEHLQESAVTGDFLIAFDRETLSQWRDRQRDNPQWTSAFAIGDLVRKKSGSWWEGRVVGFYSTEQTPAGVCVQLDKPMGPVQIYPASALELVEKVSPELQVVSKYVSEVLQQFAEPVETPPPQTHVALPQDVIDLVIAAREALQYLYGMDGCELRSLDKAVEAFADRVPYENEPAGPEASEG